MQMMNIRHAFFAVVIGLGSFVLLFPSIVRSAPYQRPPATESFNLAELEIEPMCPDVDPVWRERQVIEGMLVEASPFCSPDNPADIAAFVKGTNNVSHDTIMETQLAMDAVTKGEDRDGDGDPDVIHLRLEVAELNGFSPDTPEPIPAYSIAPGVQPGFWVFAPKTRGMSTLNFESLQANAYLRAPSPVIRVEQGDTIKITLENTHYLPHTIHFHGVDHPFVNAAGEGNDGVPQTSELPLMPGESRTYEMTPRHAGTMLYHCHVQPHAHIGMGLVGLMVVEENRPSNWVQTLNVGGGHVRHPSVAVKETYDREYDLLYQSVDKTLADKIKIANDARLISKAINRDYNITENPTNYFLLNGRSFPYTLRESLVVVKPNELVKIRMGNAGQDPAYIHSHGHKMTITAYDGAPHNPEAWITRDVYELGPAQRIDLALNTSIDGFHSYGEGIWLLHDHTERAVTTDGMNPGGDVTSIVYESFLGEEGMPLGRGVDLKPYFSKEFYQKEVPVWASFDQENLFGEISKVPDQLRIQPALLAFGVGLLLGGIVIGIRSIMILKRRSKEV
ncbi:Multicopper oxidase, type 3 [Nitrosococcus oceani ATCC 19707]|uniref:Multicopper oxidase, type 3 n=4 Tax=Nitrosococcus oceani TaxID=1229 RepID=Q3J887_NITOC|nr:Multicopper oxidase, type 3 [Nitrosococcus oceani ATCC 19707]KFI18758.1 multicopper oxidase [Nitrosococcus oceani C-27]